MNKWVDTDLHDPRNAKEAARLSALAYFDNEGPDRSNGSDIRFHDDETDTTGYGWASDDQIVLAFRGTSSAKDAAIDLKFHKVPFLTADESGTGAFSVADIKRAHHGYVHRGFLMAAGSVWDSIRHWLLNNYKGQPIFITGHSLGAAVATVLAMRMQQDSHEFRVTALYTFGCPRVGDVKFCRLFDEMIRHYRYVNNNDVVTRLPPPWTLARHTGFEYYFNRRGERVVLGWFGKFWDRLAGRFSGSLIDGIKDHSISEYVTHLAHA
jgi:pimeloyl-ACP methyl ester carboxylesterase